MKYRRSKLQRRILESLSGNKSKSQAQIAKMVEAHPASVSRSIKKLIEQGVIIKYGSLYKKKGVSIENLRDKSRKAKVPGLHPKNSFTEGRDYISTFELFNNRLNDYNKNIIGFENIFNNTAVKRFEELMTRLDTQLKPLHELDTLLNSINIPNIKLTSESEITALQDASAKLDTLNDLNLDLNSLNELKSTINRIQPLDELIELKDEICNLGEITRIGSSTLNELSSMQIELDKLNDLQMKLALSFENSIINYETGLDSILSTNFDNIKKIGPLVNRRELTNAIKGLTINMHDYVKSTVGLGIEHILTNEPYIVSELEINSSIFKDFGHSFKDLLHLTRETITEDYEEVTDDSENDYVLTDIDSLECNDRLVALLNELDPKYAKKYQGALHVIDTDSPDAISQAAHSLRELHDQIIRDYVNDEELRIFKKLNEDERVTRKHRLEFIYRDKSRTEIKLVNSFADTWILLVDSHLKVCHTGESHPSWLRIEQIIRMSENMIYEVCIEIRELNNKQ